MKYFILNTINKYGYAGIILLITLENIFPPIPSELILTVSGFLSTNTNLSITYLIISSTIGSLIGALILYLLGYIMNQSFIDKISKIKFLHMDIDKINNSVCLFNENGVKTIFLARLVPIIRSLISIPAGISKMNIYIFIIFTTIGSFIWNTTLILTGNILGENYELILYYLSKYKLLVILIIILLIIYKAYTKYKKKHIIH